MELKHTYDQSATTRIVLLIVPYGIETTVTNAMVDSVSLLIVPYGIETEGEVECHIFELAFNRTLWN